MTSQKRRPKCNEKTRRQKKRRKKGAKLFQNAAKVLLNSHLSNKRASRLLFFQILHPLHTANILLVKNTTFCCVLFPMYFQCIFSTQEILVVNGCIKCNETTALNTSFTCKFGYFLLPYNRKKVYCVVKSSSFIVQCQIYNSKTCSQSSGFMHFIHPLTTSIS